MSEFVVGQWVDRKNVLWQIEAVEPEIGILFLKVYGSSYADDCTPFQWQVGKTYRTTLEGAFGKVLSIDDKGDIYGNVMGHPLILSNYWHAKTGRDFNEQRGADLLPYLADEPNKADAKPDASDQINPQHYRTHTSGVECIEIAEHYSYCRGNAIKYLLQAGQEDDEFIALKQAAWYLQREIERLEKQRKGGA